MAIDSLKRCASQVGTGALGAGTLNGVVAAHTTTGLAAGTHSITAIYAGDANFVSVTSAAVSQSAQDFSLNISGSGGSPVTIVPGGTADFNFTLSPSNATFPAAISLSLKGLPTGATCTLTPATIPSGAGATNVPLSIVDPQQTARLHRGLETGTVGRSLELVSLADAEGGERINRHYP
ncbi:MAG TPA: Ig-like domain-containing protein [Acidobacteriaceae bacterium]